MPYKDKDLAKKYAKEYREKRREYLIEQQKNHYQKNKEQIRVDQKAYREENKETIRRGKKKYVEDNREKVKEYRRGLYARKMETNLNFKLKKSLRQRFYGAVKNSKTTKSKKTLTILGCSIEELKIHLESLFLTGMTWKNYGLYGWHIDHIKPCAAFDLTDVTQQAACFHYTNMQPLWREDNLKKSDTF